MKINLIDTRTGEPYASRAVLASFKDSKTGQQTDTLTLRTSQTGSLVIDQKYQGQKVSISINGTQTPWVTAQDETTIQLDTANANTGAGTGTGSGGLGGGTGGKSGTGTGGGAGSTGKSGTGTGTGTGTGSGKKQSHEKST